ncbi:MAG TPA: A/G-specific adenine glycosylase, partial [Alphaproteobacteria bacterium]
MPPQNFGRKLSETSINSFRKSLLAWYDKNRRVLPWRALPGQAADPYRVWLSEIMLQQTVVAAVIPYFLKFTERWPRVADLAAAPAEDVMSAWAGLGYYARARNLHKCVQAVAGQGGKFPSDIESLQELPGIGDYTSAAIAAIAFDKPATVVDGNVERVVARYFKITEPLPAGKKEIRVHAGYLSDGRTDRPGDFAQAMMDLGATVCTPQSPRCGFCPVNAGCEARKAGIVEQLPARAKKVPKPYKYGHVYWITDRKGRVLFERRPDKGLLAATVGLPTSEWKEGRSAHASFALAALKGNRPVRDHKIFHSFTHF